MVLRIGSLLFYPQSLMLPLAAIFFVVIARARLRLQLERSEGGIWLGLACSALFAAAASWFWNDHGDPSALIGGQSSLAAYWGCFAGVGLWAFLRRCGVRAAANAIAPGVMAGGAVARLGCVFAGCCQGSTSLPMFTLWPAFDIGALTVALAVGLKLEKRRADGPLLAFLLVYGLLRFALEFARPAPALLLGLSAPQMLAAAQAAAGFAILCFAESKANVGRDKKLQRI